MIVGLFSGMISGNIIYDYWWQTLVVNDGDDCAYSDQSLYHKIISV